MAAGTSDSDERRATAAERMKRARRRAEVLELVQKALSGSAKDRHRTAIALSDAHAADQAALGLDETAERARERSSNARKRLRRAPD